MPQVVIGKLGDQTFTISDPYVSSKHALLIIKDNNRMSLVDTNSRNGTFLYNGTQFVQLKPKQEYPVTPDSFVRLGPHTQFHIRRVMPEEKKCDVSHLRMIYDNYNATKLKLQTDTQRTGNLRSSTILISLIVMPAVKYMLGAMMPELSEEKTWIIGAVVALVAFILLYIFLGNSAQRNIKASNENEHNFLKYYVCPQCGHSFKGMIYEHIINSGSCPKCKVKFYDGLPQMPQNPQMAQMQMPQFSQPH